MDGPTWIAVFDSMPMKHSLVTLNMEDSIDIDEQCLKIITQNAPNLRHLFLTAYWNSITDEGCSYVGTHCTKLETLNINRSDLLSLSFSTKHEKSVAQPE